MNIVQYTCIKYSALHNQCEWEYIIAFSTDQRERESERVDYYYNHISLHHNDVITITQCVCKGIQY